ncbi:MAG: hypothetical protein PHR14_01860 [Oscillospiraceae bacterium]|nr:hypothetical protein [Oscillospiraceae bacterium]
MAKKKNSKNIPLPILLLICAVLLFGIYTSVSTLMLAIWGESVMGTVDSYDNRLYNSTAEVRRSRTISKGYWFVVNGKEYRGYVIYSSDEAWPDLDEGETRSERIRYLDIFPYINKPVMLADFDEMGVSGLLYHLFVPVGCLFLFLLVSGNLNRKKNRKKVIKKSKVNTSGDDDPPLQENTLENIDITR